MQSPSSQLRVRQFSRRALLRGAGIGLAAVSAGSVLGACTLGESAPAEPDPLIALAAAARADDQTATELAILLPDRAVVLNTVAAERSAHADALETELGRATGTSTAAPEPTESVPAAAPQPTLDGLRTALAAAQRSAADTARQSSRYRAGLTGSISAACAAQNEVLLS